MLELSDTSADDGPRIGRGIRPGIRPGIGRGITGR